MRPDITVGGTFPDYEIPDHTDTLRKLSALQENDPMILMLARGAFCPKDRQQLHQLVAFYPQVRVAYTRIVTITTDNLLEVNELRDGVAAEWPFLHDEKRVVLKDLDIAEYTDTLHNPMIPHTFVLEPGLKIYRIYNGYWYWGRPSVAELHADLRDVTRRIRPDWDLGDREVRAAWQRGEKNKFWPYGKSLREVFGRRGGPVGQQ